MHIELNCPHCPDVARFRTDRGRSKGRLIGRCEGCRSTFSLSGGRMSTIEQGRRDEERAHRWSLARLVADARRLDGEVATATGA